MTAFPALLPMALHAEPFPAQAPSAWLDPHPLRLEAFTGGRDFHYNEESFLQRFSFGHLSAFPRPGEDGLYGIGGSITGDEFFLDINLQKTLRTDDERFGVFARMQRREDFDGRFDRQLLGLSGRLKGDWEAAVAADVTADKGRADFQYEANWRPSPERFLRLALIQPDLLYNDKSQSGNEFRRQPLTAFLHYRQPLFGAGGIETAINYSPDAVYADHQQGYSVDAGQLRLLTAATLPLDGGWQSHLQLQLERSHRDFRPLGEQGAVPGEDFDRSMHQLLWSLEASRARWSPRVGLRHFRMEEDGWFGDNFAAQGFTHRREWGAFAALTLRGGERHWWEPSLHLAKVEHRRRLLQTPAENRDEDEVLGKLNLPWRYVVDRESGAVLTLNATFRLHRLAFGGGGVQLHWPL